MPSNLLYAPPVFARQRRARRTLRWALPLHRMLTSTSCMATLAPWRGDDGYGGRCSYSIGRHLTVVGLRYLRSRFPNASCSAKQTRSAVMTWNGGRVNGLHYSASL